MNRKIWRTADGQKIRIKNLEDNHLLNIIRMFERLHQANLSCAYSLSHVFTGEQASWDIERAIDQAEEEGPSGAYPVYDDLVEEAERRGIL